MNKLEQQIKSLVSLKPEDKRFKSIVRNTEQKIFSLKAYAKNEPRIRARITLENQAERLSELLTHALC